VGTRGSTRVRGTTLRRKLGLFDTWASFNRFSTKQQPPVPSAPPVSPGGGQPATKDNVFRVPRHAGVQARLYGSIWPAPKLALAAVQRLGADGRWHTVRRTRLSRKGAYSVVVRGSATYRVAVGSLAGPQIAVR
jgi:stage II sporulation protein D